MRFLSFYWWAHRLVLLGCKLCYRLRVYGQENVPEGATLLAANHASHLDPPLVGISCPREIHFLGRETLWDSRLLGWIITRLNCHPVSRGDGDLKSMRQILSVLEQGKKLVIFPEGTRTRTGAMQEGKPGVAALALRAGVPVTPVYIHGSYDVWKAGQKRPRLRGRIAVTFGKPLYPADYKGFKRREAQEKMTADLMAAISCLRENYLEGVRPR